VHALDSTFLLLFVDEKVAVPRDPSTGKPYEKGRERIEHHIEKLSEARTPILIPTPVLAEVLVGSGTAISEYLTRIKSVPVFRIGNFDQKAAVELAMMTSAALSRGAKRGSARSDAPWQKVKIDRQIVAIAKSEGATHLGAMDEDLRSLARAEGLKVYDLGDLTLPPEKAQQEMFPDTTGKPAKPPRR
jgi:hypothetical protein